MERRGGGGAPSSSVAEYAWEKEYERTWDVITEDEEGNLTTAELDEEFVRRRR